MSKLGNSASRRTKVFSMRHLPSCLSQSSCIWDVRLQLKCFATFYGKVTVGFSVYHWQGGYGQYFQWITLCRAASWGKYPVDKVESLLILDLDVNVDLGQAFDEQKGGSYWCLDLFYEVKGVHPMNHGSSYWWSSWYLQGTRCAFDGWTSSVLMYDLYNGGS